MHVEKELFTAKAPKLRVIVRTASKLEDMELFFPYLMLLEEGFQPDVAAPGKRKLTKENGYIS